MYLTIRIKFKYPNHFIASFDLIPIVIFRYETLEKLYSYLNQDKNNYLKNQQTHLHLLTEEHFTYIYNFINPYGDFIEIIPDNKLSTNQIKFLYDFDIENNSQIVMRCQDKQSNEDELSKQFENLKKQKVTTDLYYSNFI